METFEQALDNTNKDYAEALPRPEFDDYVEICVPDCRIIEYVTLKTISLQYPGFAEKLNIIKFSSPNFSVYMKVFDDSLQNIFIEQWKQRYICFNIIDVESTNIVANIQVVKLLSTLMTNI